MNQLETASPAPPMIPAVKPSYQGTASHGSIKQIQSAIDDLKRERASQTQLNRYARLSAEECQQYAEISQQCAAEALVHSKTADRLAKSMPDSGAIVLVSIGISFLLSLVVNHLGNSNAIPQPPQPQQLTSDRR